MAQRTYHFSPGEIVYFTPSNEATAWAKGRRRVVQVLGDYVQLECGNIKLLATVAELKKVE